MVKSNNSDFNFEEPKRLAEIESIQKAIDEQYPDRRSIIRALSGYAQNIEFQNHDMCFACKSPNVVYLHNDRFVKCKNCRFQSWLTANTFFRSVKKPKAWITAIHLFENGIVVNGPELERIAGVSGSTAWGMILKIGMVFESLIGKLLPALPIETFSEAVGKRSSVTPVGESPKEEMESEKDGSDISSREGEELQNRTSSDQSLDFSSVRSMFDSDSEFHDFEKAAVGIIRELSDSPIHLDSICERAGISASTALATLTVLELGGVVLPTPGNLYSIQSSRDNQPSVSSEVTKQSLKVAGQIIAFSQNVFRLLSRKYLGIYVALYWILTDKKTWSKGLLLSTCVRFKKITDACLKKFNSASLISVPCSEA